MSRCRAEFWTPTGEFIGHGLYNNTVDQMMPWVVDDGNTAWDFYYGRGADGKAAWDRYVACRHEGEPCIIWIDHDDHWAARWCPECHVVIGELSEPDAYPEEGARTYTRGHPFPAKATPAATPPETER